MFFGLKYVIARHLRGKAAKGKSYTTGSSAQTQRSHRCAGPPPSTPVPVAYLQQLQTSIIHAAGAKLWYLTPIRRISIRSSRPLAKIKHRMLTAQKHTVDDTWRQIGSLFTTIARRKMQQLLHQCGYGSIKIWTALRPIRPRSFIGGAGARDPVQPDYPKIALL
jgi:hypothetical protein